MKRLSLLAALLLFAGCASVRDAQIRQQAAFDYGCPESQVAIQRFGPGYQSVELEACGKKRLYHRVDSGDSSTWIAQPQLETGP